MNLAKQKFSFIECAYWCSNGSVLTFIAHFFKEQGISNSSIGVLITIYTLSGFCGQLLLAYIADKIKSQKKVALVSVTINIIVVLMLFFSGVSFYVLMFLYGFFNMPIPMLIDSWILHHYKETPETYSSIRSLASLAFAFYSIPISLLITNVGTVVMPIFACALLISVILVMLLLKEEKVESHKEQVKLSELRQAKGFIAILASLVFVGIPIGISIQLQLPIVNALGGNTALFGRILFFNALIQYPVFMLYHKLNNFKIKAKIFLGLFLYFVSFFILLISATMPVYFVSVCINGIAFGILVSSLREYSARKIKSGLQTVSLSLMDSALNCIGSSVGSFIGGIILDSYTIKTLFTFNVASCVIGIMFLLVSFWKTSLSNKTI